MKIMSDLERNCYNFILKLTQELALDFDAQYQHMEDFARWNLPEEIALEWIDAEGMIEILHKSQCITKDTFNILKTIVNRFVLEFEHPNNPIWTCESMKKSDFWNIQRSSAKEAYERLKAM